MTLALTVWGLLVVSGLDPVVMRMTEGPPGLAFLCLTFPKRLVLTPTVTKW